MKKLYILMPVLMSAILLCPEAYAVTDKEMEEARTITALTYLRYANDGSGYLDECHPKTMEELKAVLKPAEKENLKTFTSVKSPTDYASWDKQKLIAYWTDTFYSSPGLLAKGKIGKTRTKSRLAKMTVSAPSGTQPAAAPTASTADTAEKKAAEKKSEEAVAAAAVAAEMEGTAVDGQVGAGVPAEVPVPEAQNAEAEAIAAADAGVQEPQQRKDSSTWIYILILAVLVITVVCLIAYASNMMKNDRRRREREEVERGDGQVSEAVAERAGNAAMREKYTESLNQKNAELRRAAKEVSELRSQLEEAHQTISELKGELAALKSQQGQKETAAAPLSRTRTIYLGRVNPKGLFVRGDKNPNPELSVYSLETEDGRTGIFRVLDTPAITGRLLEEPEKWLEWGCEGADFEDASDAEGVETLREGMALFEGGAWKVIRKAKIAFV